MKVVNIKKDIWTVFIGRPSPFGNPFRVGIDGTREEVIERFEVYARENLLGLINKLSESAILGCYCKPLACHGDVIIKLWKEMHEG